MFSIKSDKRRKCKTASGHFDSDGSNVTGLQLNLSDFSPETTLKISAKIPASHMLSKTLQSWNKTGVAIKARKYPGIPQCEQFYCVMLPKISASSKGEVSNLLIL